MAGNQYVTIGRLEVAAPLEAFIRTEVAPGTGIEPEEFWGGFEAILADLEPRARELLGARADLQTQIDRWHLKRRGLPHDPDEYEAFLGSIGYLAPAPEAVRVTTAGVDPEIATVAGPQLVVPVDNARYALNAANARWGSLYDALYGTDVIPEDDGATRDGPYNPVRGDRVIAHARELLDRHVPLASGSHADAVAYRVANGSLAVELAGGSNAGLAAGAEVAGYTGEPGDPDSVLLRRNGLGIEILIDRDHPVGAVDRAGVADICLEAALTTIMDLEDSVATVDAGDKVLAYRNWLGLMRGDLSATFAKGGREVTRTLRADSPYLDPGGNPMTLRRRSVMLVRNIGPHIETDIVRLDGAPTIETMLDAAVTAWCAVADLAGGGPHRNSASGSIYVVKPKMHGPDEAALAGELFGRVEDLLGLARNTLKMGIMDEERRTSLNLAACIAAASERVMFINTGFLDRTGDDIRTAMEAGPMIPKAEIKSATWLRTYEDANVDVGLAAGLVGRGQIGKGMWTRPDDMAAMLAEKSAHPLAGASTAWVPSPTAATLHALHYLEVDVAARQRALAERTPARALDMLQFATLPLGRELTPAELASELENNAQGILGYVSRWVGQGVGCSKVPDINDTALMEDRATLRISSQHIANWLHHGLLSAEQVHATMERMAAVVDAQNAGDPDYWPMSPDLAGSIPYQAALSLVMDGLNQPNGYTEFILIEQRRRMKAALLTPA
ncbi:MAG: malate synthase G [Acidimicrobiia bacterium]|nr:malate synthase G [Acidimicrobiia bacterium]MYB25010.1 malate synthase G [Acidimicrobiia bacterium]